MSIFGYEIEIKTYTNTFANYTISTPHFKFISYVNSKYIVFGIFNWDYVLRISKKLNYNK